MPTDTGPGKKEGIVMKEPEEGGCAVGGVKEWTGVRKLAKGWKRE
jgi:hypothetical protein